MTFIVMTTSFKKIIKLQISRNTLTESAKSKVARGMIKIQTWCSNYNIKQRDVIINLLKCKWNKSTYKKLQTGHTS